MPSNCVITLCMSLTNQALALRKVETRYIQLMHINVENIRAIFHPNPIWNDGALGFFDNGRPNNNKNNKISTDTRSVPDLNTKIAVLKTCQQVDGATHHAIVVVIVLNDRPIFQQQLHQLFDGLHKFRTRAVELLMSLAVPHQSMNRNTNKLTANLRQHAVSQIKGALCLRWIFWLII